MNSDHQLRQHVLDELDFEPMVNAAHIGVGVHRGVVTLTGFVGSYAQKLAAEHAVRRVKGVKAIAQEIEVRLPADKKSADDEIARRAVDILEWRVGVPAERIAVKVEKGIVTLSGEVDWQFQKAEAQAAIHDLSGVAEIVNLIRVAAPAEAERVKEQIEKALERSAEVEASHISVQTHEGKVVLRGRVRSLYERDVAERAAWSAPGVSAVDDRIQIEP
jgi:osmotically-inducible protein OsmY